MRPLIPLHEREFKDTMGVAVTIAVLLCGIGVLVGLVDEMGGPTQRILDDIGWPLYMLGWALFGVLAAGVFVLLRRSGTNAKWTRTPETPALQLVGTVKKVLNYRGGQQVDIPVAPEVTYKLIVEGSKFKKGELVVFDIYLWPESSPVAVLQTTKNKVERASATPPKQIRQMPLEQVQAMLTQSGSLVTARNNPFANGILHPNSGTDAPPAAHEFQQAPQQHMPGGQRMPQGQQMPSHRPSQPTQQPSAMPHQGHHTQQPPGQ